MREDARYDRPGTHRPLSGKQPHRGQESRRRLSPQPVGDLLGLCQHHRRPDLTGRGGEPGKRAERHRHPRRAGVCEALLADGQRPQQGQRQYPHPGGRGPAHHRGERDPRHHRPASRAAPAARVHRGQPLHRGLSPGRGGGLSLLPRRGPGHAPGPGRHPGGPGRLRGPYLG